MARRNQILTIAFIVFCIGFGVLAVSSLFKSKESQIRIHGNHSNLYSKIGDYNSQLAQTGKQINWNDSSSIIGALFKCQKICNEKAPYLDSMAGLIERSTASLHPENIQRSPDTLRMISWLKIYLQSLTYQKNAQLLTDSVCILVSQGQVHKPKFNQEFALLLVNDSAITATDMLEDSLRQTLGDMELPD